MDRTPPITQDNIPAGWNQTGSYVIQLTSRDYADTEHDTPSGVRATYYTTDGTTPDYSSPHNDNILGDEVFITQIPITGQGIFVIKYFSVDNDGNQEIIKTKNLELDNVSPASTPSVSIIPDGDDGWYKTNPIIQITALDDSSGVNKIFYRWNADTFQEYSSSFQVPSEGIHTLQFYSLDFAGNVEVLKTQFYKLDYQAPITSDDTPSGLQKEPVTVHFFTSDNVSGVKNTHFTTDGSTPTIQSPSGTSVLISHSGTFTIKYFSVDFAGNEESVKQATTELFIDTEAPQVYISESFPINGSNGWYRTSPDIILTSADPSGITAIKWRRYPVGATTTAKYTSPIDLSAGVDLTNDYNIRLEIDKSGTPIEINLQGTLPVQTTLSEIITKINNGVGQTIAFETSSSGGTGTGYLTVISTNAGKEDPTAEIKFLEPTGHDATNIVFGLDISYPHTFEEMVAYRDYFSPIVLPYDGQWTVDYYAIDGAENQGEPGTKQYKLDSENPVTTAQVSNPPDGDNDWYVTSPNITLNRQDNISGIFKTFYQWNQDGIILEYSDGIIITIPSEGIHTLRFYSIDLAGNIEGLKEEVFKLDSTPPVTSDNSLELQGVIFTAQAEQYSAIYYENSDYLGSISQGNIIVSIIQTRNPNVKSLLRFRDVTKDLNYRAIEITGTNKDEIKCLPYVVNENSTRINDYRIRLLSTSSELLRTFEDVLKVYNVTRGIYYTVDPSLSDKITGELQLSGERPVSVGDVLQVDYLYNGAPVSPGDVLEVDYLYDDSHEVDTLNTLDYTILTQTNTPKIHDHDVTVTLKPRDSLSGVVQTFYTKFGTDPKDGAYYTSPINLSAPVDLSINYNIRIEIDQSGNPVEIDLRGADPYQTTISEIINKINAEVGENIASETSGFITLKSTKEATDITGEIKFIQPSGYDCTEALFGLDRYSYSHIFKVYQGTTALLDKNGTYLFSYYSVDAAGNIEDTKISEYEIIIDKNIPTISLSILADPAEDGENGWYKKAFRFQADITSDDIMTRLDDVAQDVTQFRIETSVNDKLDFEETTGIEKFIEIPSIEITGFNNKIDFEETVSTPLVAVLTPGIYTADGLCTEIQTQLNVVGASNYTVTFSAKKYTIVSDLTGGTSVFNILFGSGINTNNSPVIILGFNRVDSTGLGTYESSDEIKTAYLYSRAALVNKLALLLNDAGDSTYTVSIVDDQTNSVGYHFSLSSDLSGGGNVFNLIWQTGTHAIESVGQTIGFNTFYDGTGLDTYISEFFKIKVSYFFIESVLGVVNATTGEELSVEQIQKGASGFYDELLVNGNIPDPDQQIKVDYRHYVGIDRADFGLDTTTFTTSINIYNDVDKFLGIYDNRVNFRIVFPALSGQFFIQDGQHTVFARSYDHNSILVTDIPQKVSILESQFFKLDRRVPITTDDIQDVGWQKGSATITLTSEDSVPGSGIAATHYTIDGNPPTRLSPKIQDLPNQKIVIDQSGTYTIKYFAVDNAGNVEPIKTAAYQVFVDANAPETTMFTSPVVPDGDNGWFVSDPVVGFNVTEFHSGVYKTYYKLPGELIFNEFTAPFTLPDEGEIEVKFYSVDNVGNQEEEKTTHIRFDRTVPITTTNIPVIGYTSDPTVVFTINDASSGGWVTYFTIDGTTPDFTSPSGSQVAFHSSGTYTIKFFSLDMAGNVESVKTQTLRLDLEIPVVSNFDPPDGIVTDSTTQITFDISDDLSGVDISSIIFDVDGIEYSRTKNTSYFHYTGTSALYTVTIYPIQDVLNFEDIQKLTLRNVRDFAGNEATVIEFDFSKADTTPPRIRELYPIPNATDVSTNSNVIVFISDEESGVDIESVRINIRGSEYRIITNEVLKIQYVGTAETATITIAHNVLRTVINGGQDVVLSLVDANYDTIKKVNDYINALPDYTCSVIDSRFEQNASKHLLTINGVDLKVDPILKLFIPVNNLNFSFIERETGYLIFVTPTFVFEHGMPVKIIISASDNSGNSMAPYSYYFTPSIVAVLSVRKRNYLNKTALTFIDDIQSNMASNYTRSRSTNFYGHHKSIGKELSRVQEELDHLIEDQDFNTVRSFYLYQKFGYLLEMPPDSGFSHNDYHRLLLSLLAIFFQGSKKSSLEIGTSLFTGSKVQIREVVFSEGSDISDQFVFTADIVLGDNRLLGLDLQLVSEQLDKMFQLVKPAHVFIIKRYIFTDAFGFGAGCTLQWLKDQYGNYVYDQFGNKIPIIGVGGFQAAVSNGPTAICDRYKYILDTLYQEDVRTNCSEIQTEIQVVAEDVSVQFTGTQDSFVTFFKPLLKDTIPPEVAGINDIVVTVNGIGVNVLEIDPISGSVKIDAIPGEFDVVIATYYYNQNFVFRQLTFYLNDYTVSGNDFDQNQKSILNHQNVNDVSGGFLIDERKHAHVCETSLHFEIDQSIPEVYTIPECNDNRYFYLNNYTVAGNDFDKDRSSCLNDIHVVNRSTKCPYLFLEIEDKRKEGIQPPDMQLTDMTIDGRNFGLTFDGYYTKDAFFVDPSPKHSPLNAVRTRMFGATPGVEEFLVSIGFDYSESNINLTVDTYSWELELNAEIEYVTAIEIEQCTEIIIDGRINDGFTNDFYNSGIFIVAPANLSAENGILNDTSFLVGKKKVLQDAIPSIGLESHETINFIDDFVPFFEINGYGEEIEIIDSNLSSIEISGEFTYDRYGSGGFIISPFDDPDLIGILNDPNFRLNNIRPYDQAVSFEVNFKENADKILKSNAFILNDVQTTLNSANDFLNGESGDELFETLIDKHEEEIHAVNAVLSGEINILETDSYGVGGFIVSPDDPDVMGILNDQNFRLNYVVPSDEWTGEIDISLSDNMFRIGFVLNDIGSNLNDKLIFIEPIRYDEYSVKFTMSEPIEVVSALDAIRSEIDELLEETMARGTDSVAGYLVAPKFDLSPDAVDEGLTNTKGVLNENQYIVLTF